MLRLSQEQADAVRLWLKLTSAIYGAGKSIVAVPDRPLGWMILALVATQPDEAASYAIVRQAFGLESASLSQAIGPLLDDELLLSVPVPTHWRERRLILTNQGREAVGAILSAAYPRTDT